ncbi:hypothetical protein ACFVYT_17765 [Streptomyces sp. NPDC058290]|uniref:hypothetical protein n=1 Tax=Streptomyces sp. NPDC058290 TaxID=3346426 RepID=UPI0036EA7D34
MSWTMPRPSTARCAVASRAALSAVVLAACGLLLVGCSSGSGAARAAATVSASASPDAKAMDAYRQCLAQHGVTMAPRPSGSGRPSGGTRGPGAGADGWGGASGGSGRGASADPQRREATQACADLRPQFNGRGGGPGGDGSAMKAFSSCLKDHGVVLPSASPGGSPVRGLPTSDPQSAQAFETCKALLPQRGQKTPEPGVSPSA